MTDELEPLADLDDLPPIDDSAPLDKAPPKPPKPRKPRRAGPAAYSEAPSENIHVNTPDRELDLVRAFAPIGLDPCSNAASRVLARIEWWGAQPKCHFCAAPAVYGLSIAAIDRCSVHRYEPDTDDGVSRPRFEISAYVLGDSRFGQDGLALSWSGAVAEHEVVFLQPPYGKYIKPWIPKANNESLKGCGEGIIGLLPGRYDTKWFNALRPTAICWYRHRIPYRDSTRPDQKDSAKFPSVFVYWGANVDRFHDKFEGHGTITEWKP